MSTYERLVNSQNFFSPYLTQEDLSRLGRNYLKTGELIEIVFPEYEVRYIAINDGVDTARETSVYKGYKRDKIEMRGDRAEMSDFPLYLNTVAGGLDRRDQTIGGFSFVVKIYAVPVVEIIG